MLKFIYRREATLAAFQIISLIINRRKIDINSKQKHVEVAKKYAASSSSVDIAGAMLRLHYRISKLLEWDGLLHEIDQQIGKDEEDGFQEFVEKVIPDYLSFFGIDNFQEKIEEKVDPLDFFSRPIGKGADRTSDLDKTPVEEPTGAGDVAMTSSNSGLAT